MLRWVEVDYAQCQDSYQASVMILSLIGMMRLQDAIRWSVNVNDWIWI